jgi:hypothetical protein
MVAAYRGEFIAWGVQGGRDEEKARYNWRMYLAKIAINILDTMFFVGLVGSAVVVVISFIEDGKELFGKDEPTHPHA